MLNFYQRKHCLTVALVGLLALPVYATTPPAPTTTPAPTNTPSAEAKPATETPTVTLPAANLSPLEQYRSLTRQTETLKIYNQHLQELLKSQAQEKASLEQQLKDIEVTKREILPMALKMLDSLDKFVALDVPFLPEERKQRLARLKEDMVKADITNAEKFRRIMEAFQVENGYGNTLEAYKGTLSLNGVPSSVDFLRLGRVALYYQRLDGSESGFWNKQEKRWQALSSDYTAAIRKGLRIARKETAPDMLTIPVPAPEAAK